MHCVWRLTELGGERGETVSVTDGVTVKREFEEEVGNLAIYPEQQALFKNPDPNPDPIPNSSPSPNPSSILPLASPRKGLFLPEGARFFV